MRPRAARTRNRLKAAAAVAALLGGHAAGAETADPARAAAPLDGRDIFVFSQVLRRNSGPDIRQSAPEAAPDATTPAEDEIDAAGRSRPGGLTGRE
ncbi:MAG: hypothetical protein ACK5MQ_01580, partial [Pikeienuella sp.]